MATFAPEMTLREARDLHFQLNGLGDGGYEDRWLKVRVWRIPFWFPNTKSRRRAVPFHDVHHVLTEYETTWRGESEIGAWEVATGLGRHWAGWFLDLSAFALGLIINTSGVYGAFLRGRQTSNFYDREWDGALLARRVGECREELGLCKELRPPTLADNLSFVFWSVLAVGCYLLTVLMYLLPFGTLLGAVLLLTKGF